MTYSVSTCSNSDLGIILCDVWLGDRKVAEVTTELITETLAIYMDGQVIREDAPLPWSYDGNLMALVEMVQVSQIPEAAKTLAINSIRNSGRGRMRFDA